MNQAANYNPMKGIGTTSASAGGNYILPGKHTLQIVECKMVRSSVKNTDLFVVEFLVVESTNAAMTPGSRRSWIANFQHPSALGNVKAFCVAAYNCTESDVDEELANSLVHSSQPARGVVLSCEANLVKTRKGGDFTKCLWTYLQAA